MGCKVIATAGSDEKRRICKGRGWADEAVDYTKDGWQVGSPSTGNTADLLSCWVRKK
jgi:NADPH-dependent curcumin reductase CurA